MCSVCGDGQINVEPASENGEQTVSVYCDSFVIDITLANGQGEVKSVKLTHVSKGKCFLESILKKLVCWIVYPAFEARKNDVSV